MPASARVLRRPQAAAVAGWAAAFLVTVVAARGALDFLASNATWRGTVEDCRRASGFCWPFVRESLLPLLRGYGLGRDRWWELALVGTLAVIVVAAPGGRRRIVACAVIPLLVAAAGLLFGPAASAGFGGACLTIALSVCSIALGLPAGIVLALMRESRLPVLRWLAGIWIEVWRGVPTVVVLFLAVTVFPLLVPDGTAVTKLVRALAAFVVLTSALFAEAMRAGLRGVPDTQREAATALGLGAVGTLRRVVLPQAVAIALPSFVNVSVALLKETTLILIVGLYDIFGVVQLAVVNPRFASRSVTLTGYAVAAAAYLVLCGGLSLVASVLARPGATRSWKRSRQRARRHPSEGDPSGTPP